MTAGQVLDPGLEAGQVIDFQTEADVEIRVVLTRFLHPGDVEVQLFRWHAPIVEVVLRHRRVVGETDFLKPDPAGRSGVFGGLAGGVPAEAGVGVVIGRQPHDRSRRKNRAVGKRNVLFCPAPGGTMRA